MHRMRPIRARSDQQAIRSASAWPFPCPPWPSPPHRPLPLRSAPTGTGCRFCPAVALRKQLARGSYRTRGADPRRRRIDRVTEHCVFAALYHSSESSGRRKPIGESPGIKNISSDRTTHSPLSHFGSRQPPHPPQRQHATDRRRDALLEYTGQPRSLLLVFQLAIVQVDVHRQPPLFPGVVRAHPRSQTRRNPDSRPAARPARARIAAHHPPSANLASSGSANNDSSRQIGSPSCRQ